MTRLSAAGVAFLALLCSQVGLAKSDLNGIWQTLGNQDWNIEPHRAAASPVLDAGAFAAEQAGLGLIHGDQIPYTEAARKQQQQNYLVRYEKDPARQCYLPGVPRSNYLPYPLQIVQNDKHIFIAYEFGQASRTIYMDQPDFEAPVDAWMGHSLGHWEDDTLVVDVTAQVADTWLDRAGNFHSGALHVQERYTLLSDHHMRYEATLTDPEVYTRPWTLSTILYKNVDPKAQLLDFKCIEFVEERMYGHLSK